ncbi:MAG: tripartite tricarboxylate transporter substrate binding protein [Candidatus Hydrogenedentes bacterium]|nr:tripartite tricarboxylate transporter substrate binding protein [Candidatus Hydrogenedentota bacterium]
MMKRRTLLGALATAAWLDSLPAAAQGYPDKPIKIIVPLPPGSPPDILARLIGENMGKTLKQPVIVENRPGATGMIGMQAVARSAPDGYTFGVLFLTHTVLPELMGPLPYDTARDLAPVANLVWLYNALVVPAASPIKTLQDLIAAAKARPDALTYASGGNGSPAHLIGDSFCQASKITMMHVPFKGPSDALSALVGDQISVMFASTSVAAPLVRGGKLRAIAVTSPQRLPALPEVPTFAESGQGDIALRGEWEGLVAPAGTPRAIIEQWNRELFKILAVPDVRSRLSDLGMVVADPNQPQEFGALIRSELDHWGRFVKAAGLRSS